MGNYKKMLNDNIRAELTESNYLCNINTRTFSFQADEPIEKGGTNQAPTPTEFLLASLASCTVITLKMYADRKTWVLGKLKAECSEILYDNDNQPFVNKKIIVSGNLDSLQQKRLLVIADKCPISKLLAASIRMNSSIIVENED